MVLLALGCGDAAGDGAQEGSSGATSEVEPGVYPGSEGPLIDLGAWEVATDDPFPDRPEDLDCSAGFGIEDGLFEVDTGLCPNAAFVQPSGVPVRVGDEIEVIVLHDALYSEEEGTDAHIGIAIGDAIAWETRIPIPAEPGFLRPKFASEVDAPRGTPVTLHIHNHGINSYRLLSATVFWAE